MPWVVTRKDGDIEELRRHLSGRTSVLLGHSGVGKSTLVNALLPDAERAVGHVNAVTGRGRHTSTSALMLPLPEPDSWIIDTPGIRTGEADPARVESFRRLLVARSESAY